MPTPSRGAARRSSPLASLGPPGGECPQPRACGGPEPPLWPRSPGHTKCLLPAPTSHTPSLPRCPSLRAGRGRAASKRAEAPGEQPGFPASGGQAEPAGRAVVLPSFSGQSLTSTLQTSNTSAERGSHASHHSPITEALSEHHDESLASSPESPEMSADPTRHKGAISSGPA